MENCILIRNLANIDARHFNLRQAIPEHKSFNIYSGTSLNRHLLETDKMPWYGQKYARYRCTVKLLVNNNCVDHWQRCPLPTPAQQRPTPAPQQTILKNGRISAFRWSPLLRSFIAAKRRPILLTHSEVQLLCTSKTNLGQKNFQFLVPHFSKIFWQHNVYYH